MNLITNKWQSFEYDLNNAILNKYNFTRSILKIKKAILLNLTNKQTCSVMFKVQLTEDRKSTRLNSSHSGESRMPSSA